MEWLNIAAGIITVITGILAIMQYIKQTKKPPVSPAATGDIASGNKPVKVKPPKVINSPTPMPATASVMGVQTFSGDDKAYQEWVKSHPQGFVVNTNQGGSSKYMPLHKATCSFISNFNTHEQGAFTERGFMKVCATEVGPLKEWAKAHGRMDGSFTGNCKCLSGGNL